MSGCYLTFNPGTCQVYLTSTAIQGSSIWYPGLPSQTGGTNYGAAAFNTQYPGYITVPAHCMPPVGKYPPGQTPPPPAPPPPVPPVPPEETDPPPAEVPGPITADPPIEGCGAGPAMGTVEESGGQDTSSSFFQTGDSPSRTDGKTAFDNLVQPLVMGLTPLPTYDDAAFSVGKPIYTQDVYVETRQGSQEVVMDVYHEGTGPGLTVFHPPELQDYMLHGSGENPDSRWPTNISASTVMLHNSGRADGSTGDDAVTYFAMGVPLKLTSKPGSGIYFSIDPSVYEFKIATTGVTGADVDNGVFTLEGMALNLGQQATAGLGLYTGAQAGSLIWDTTDEEVKYYNGSAWLSLASADEIESRAQWGDWRG